MLYAELQFPVTSNYGSMKKRGQREKARQQQQQQSQQPDASMLGPLSVGDRHSNNTASTTVLSSAGEPSPPHSEDSNAAMAAGMGGTGNSNSILSAQVCNLYKATE